MSQDTPSFSLILNKLNDDELCIIFSYLDILQLIETERVCQRFAAVIRQMYKSYKVLDLECVWNRRDLRSISRLEAEKIATRVGSNVETLTISNHDDILEISEFFDIFSKLDTLKFWTYRYGMCGAFSKDLSLKTITNLEWNEQVNCYIDDLDLMKLVELKQLESLKLRCFMSIRGTFLTKLFNIQVLNLDECHSINPKHFIEFCNEHPNLRSLTIFACNWLDEKCLRSVATNLKNLEELSVCIDRDTVQHYLVLAQLTKLKHLELKSLRCAHLNKEMLSELLSQMFRNNNLTSLSLKYFTITKEIKDAFKNLPYLQKLTLLKCTWDNSTLDALPCENNITHLTLNYERNTHNDVIKLITRSPSVKFVKLFVDNTYYYGNSDSLAVTISKSKYLKERTHMLELEIEMNTICPFGCVYEKYFGMNPSKLTLVNRQKTKWYRTFDRREIARDITIM